MSETKWTPGPWKVNKYGSIGAGPLGHMPVVGYVEPFYGEDKRDGDSSANASLIAAAPELYEALTNLTRFCAAYRAIREDKSEHLARVISAARAAIAKARGESEAQS